MHQLPKGISGAELGTEFLNPRAEPYLQDHLFSLWGCTSETAILTETQPSYYLYRHISIAPSLCVVEIMEHGGRHNQVPLIPSSICHNVFSGKQSDFPQAGNEIAKADAYFTQFFKPKRVKSSAQSGHIQQDLAASVRSCLLLMAVARQGKAASIPQVKCSCS